MPTKSFYPLKYRLKLKRICKRFLPTKYAYIMQYIQNVYIKRSKYVKLLDYQINIFKAKHNMPHSYRENYKPSLFTFHIL